MRGGGGGGKFFFSFCCDATSRLSFSRWAGVGFRSFLLYFCCLFCCFLVGGGGGGGGPPPPPRWSSSRSPECIWPTLSQRPVLIIINRWKSYAVWKYLQMTTD